MGRTGPYLMERLLTELTLAGLEKALSYSRGTHDVGDVVAQILRGDAQLWEDTDALIVTEVYTMPRRKVVHFWLATGEMAPVIQLHYRVLDWAKEQGCTLATLAGRRGWTKALADAGWETDMVFMGRELEDG